MHWRDFLIFSQAATMLEKRLSPTLVEHIEGMKSTAHTDIRKRTIHIDITQTEIKCALSYAYELKNLENAEKYLELEKRAKEDEISKSQFVGAVISVEAEAIYFRCRVIKQLQNHSQEAIPANEAYMSIFNDGSSDTQILKNLKRYIIEHGVVRREIAAKKYYADYYDIIMKKNGLQDQIGATNKH